MTDRSRYSKDNLRYDASLDKSPPVKAMNLNDPFNRLSRRQQSEYAAFHRSMKESAIGSSTQARALLANIWKRTWSIASVLAGITLTGSLLFPELAIVTMTFGVLALLWLLTTTFKGQRFMRRFIQDEFNEPPNTSE